MTITFTANSIIQGVATLVQVLNILLPVLREDQKIYAAAGIALLQGVASLVGHKSNPDGTPVSEAYIKEIK